jgi:hypothetical protein
MVCSVIPKPSWVEEDCGGIISSKTYGELNRDQFTPNPLLTGIEEPGLRNQARLCSQSHGVANCPQFILKYKC